MRRCRRACVTVDYTFAGKIMYILENYKQDGDAEAKRTDFSAAYAEKVSFSIAVEINELERFERLMLDATNGSAAIIFSPPEYLETR